jgi:hypothetical protein
MAGYLHAHETEITPFNYPSRVDFTFLLINYTPTPPNVRNLAKYNKIVESHTPMVSHLLHLYIHNKIRVQQTTLVPTVEEKKMVAAAIRRFETNPECANWYISTVYLPARIPDHLKPHYRKLIDFIQNVEAYDFTNPAIWVYHSALEYYVLKPNILFSLQIPLDGPTFWICRNARDKYYSLIEVCSVFSCPECHGRRGHKNVNMTIDPLMFKSDAVVPTDIKTNAWKFVLGNIQQ